MAAPETCPVCGADVSPNAKACPECGACDETGWSEAAGASGLDLPEEEFDYDDFVAREFGDANPRPRGVNWLWWIVGVVLATLFLVLLFHGK